MRLAARGPWVLSRGWLGARLGLGFGGFLGPGVLAAIGLFEVDDLAQQDAARGQLLAPDHDGLEGQGAFAQAPDHGVAAGLDALGDGDLALARQQFDRPHFAQVHADRVVGAAEIAVVDVAGGGLLAFLGLFLGLGVVGGFFLFLVFNHVDAHFGEHRHGVFDLLGGDVFRRQRGGQSVSEPADTQDHAKGTLCVDYIAKL